MHISMIAVLAVVLAAPEVCAQKTPTPPEVDRIRIGEAFRLADALGNRIWPEWDKAPFAVLLVTPEYEFLIRHPNPTEEFALAGADSVLRGKVWFRKRKYPTSFLATFPAVGGVHTVVVGQAENTEAKHSTRWVITLLHEHFHQLQDSRPRFFVEVNALGLARGDTTGMWMLNYPFPYTKPNIKEQFSVMAKALAQALEVREQPEFNEKLGSYLETRKRFRSLLQADDYKYFAFQIWKEGIARYTEIHLAELAAAEYKPSTEFQQLKDYRSFKDVAREIADAFEIEVKSVDLEKAKRTVVYNFGAAEGLILDRAKPDWRKQYFEEKFALDAHFRSANEAARTSPAVNATDADPSPPGRMFVVGRVLDPRGNPVAGAAVMIHARDLSPGRIPFLTRLKLIALGDARADGTGRFRIDAPRLFSTRYTDFGVVAIAPGYGAGWITFDPDDDEPTVDISLRPEQLIHGRLFDVLGRPIPNVLVSVMSISSDRRLTPAGLYDRFVRHRSDGVTYWSRDAHEYPAWPRPVTTDLEGRFTMRGVGQNLHVDLAVDDPRFARQTILVDTDDGAESKSLTAALAPPQILNVYVTYADTRQPVARAALRVSAIQGTSGKLDESETGADGRARINSWPTDRGYSVIAYPPNGQPYLGASGTVNWPKGALQQTLNLSLPRGVLVHGKVTEQGSSKPVSGALVRFVTRDAAAGDDWSISVHTDPNGSYRLGAELKSGYVFVRAADDDYVFEAIGSRMIRQGTSGGSRFYMHAHAAINLKPGMGSQEVNLALRRGATLAGRVVGQDGTPIRQAWIFSRLILDPSTGAQTRWTGRYHDKLRNGRFEIRGVADRGDVPLYFLEPKRKLGAVAHVSAKSATGGPMTVRLEPCGAARTWLVDSDGKPIVKPVRNLFTLMVVTPGPAGNGFPNENAGSPFSADEGRLTDVDPINYETEPAPDVTGRITLPVLIPGATYRVIDYSTFVRDKTGPEIRKEFTVKPGQKLDLGDIVVTKPPA